MELDLKIESNPDEKNISRLNTPSSVAYSSEAQEKIPNDYIITENSNEKHEIGKNENISVSQTTFVEIKAPENPYQKYFRLGLLIQFLIVLKDLMLSVCLFKIQLLALGIIFDFLGLIAVCHMVKKMVNFYVVIICIMFIVKIFGILKIFQDYRDSEYFDLLYGMLICAQLIEGIQGVLLVIFAYNIFQMDQSRIDELYDKNCCCCKSKKSK